MPHSATLIKRCASHVYTWLHDLCLIQDSPRQSATQQMQSDVIEKGSVNRSLLWISTVNLYCESCPWCCLSPEAAVAGDVQCRPNRAEAEPHSPDPETGWRPPTGHDHSTNVLSLWEGGLKQGHISNMDICPILVSGEVPLYIIEIFVWSWIIHELICVLQLWEEDGLSDLCLIPYGCMATGPKTGFIEVVNNARTIAEVRRVLFLSSSNFANQTSVYFLCDTHSHQ